MHANLFVKKTTKTGKQEEKEKLKRKIIVTLSLESSFSHNPAADRKSHIMLAKRKDTRGSLKET